MPDATPPIVTKRIYAATESTDGLRILVDRLWPRGLTKAAAALDAWVPEVAPSTDLRTWFGHEPERWDAFMRRYWAELDDNPAVADLRARIGTMPTTLLYSARDEQHNQAVALRAYLLGRS